MKILQILSFAAISIFFLLGCKMSDSNKSKVYYVSAEGKDDNTGTIDKPLKTIEKINNLNLKPGDTVLFKGNQTFQGTLILDSLDSGDEMKHVVISSYGKGRAILDGQAGSALQADFCSYLLIQNIDFKGIGRKNGNTEDGVYISNGNHIHVDQVEVSGFQHSGLRLHICDHSKITNVYAHDNGFAGIHVTGTTIRDSVNYDNQDLYIGYCIAENNPGDPTVTSNHSGNGILASSVDGGIIEYCVAFNNGWDMPWTGNGPVGIWIWDANDFIIQHCIAHHNKTAKGAHDGGGFDFDGGVSNSIMQYNISYENEGPGIGLFEFGAAKPWHDNIVRYNLSVNDSHTTKGGLRIWRAEGKGEMYNCDIYNNTIYSGNEGNYAIGILTNCPGMRFYNNIFIYDHRFLPEEHKIIEERFFRNIYFQLKGKEGFLDYPSLDAWASATGNEMLEGDFVGMLADPLLKGPGSSELPESPKDILQANLYAPVEGSPAVNNGLNLQDLFSLDSGGKDLIGNQIPVGTGYDIGGIEFLE